jgi:hypothetical protein
VLAASSAQHNYVPQRLPTGSAPRCFRAVSVSSISFLVLFWLPSLFLARSVSHIHTHTHTLTHSHTLSVVEQAWRHQIDGVSVSAEQIQTSSPCVPSLCPCIRAKIGLCILSRCSGAMSNLTVVAPSVVGVTPCGTNLFSKPFFPISAFPNLFFVEIKEDMWPHCQRLRSD